MRWMLDIHTVSDLLRPAARTLRRASEHLVSALGISAPTEAQTRLGLARRPEAARSHEAVRQLLLRVQPLPWNSSAAEVLGSLRSRLQAQGQRSSPLDVQIAAHALSFGAGQGTCERAFAQVPGLDLEDRSQ